jgi:hypothetical protein
LNLHLNLSPFLHPLDPQHCNLPFRHNNSSSHGLLLLDFAILLRWRCRWGGNDLRLSLPFEDFNDDISFICVVEAFAATGDRAVSFEDDIEFSVVGFYAEGVN